ncbi:hypothetical protein [Aureimonas pseudogalii]|uniref:FCP1 homology domain-containing protein n=1 Tax=Aureimonas pseudogalii TaxID=1744844 RepID=A0A7W6MK30_9HYPH|nr:hypothetical protein [Aureimonas pseudogalii]MBB3998755.1 hypothetical protein [Aureimonas pseudogalii]
MIAASVTVGPDVTSLPQQHDALVVLDIDEVVLHFIAPFCDLLAEHGAQLHFDSFKLTGNVRSLSTGAALTGHSLDGITAQLYAEQARRQSPVDGVVQAVERLSEIADVVFLTAMTPSFYEQRRALLNKVGLRAPMIATDRPKGAFLAEMRKRWRGPIAFVDDLPPNLVGVRRSAPDVHLVHLMADPRFRQHLPPLPSGARSAVDWPEAEAILQAIVLGDER